MFDTKKALLQFTHLSHTDKVSKMKEVLSILKTKSEFFADIEKHFRAHRDISDDMMDYLYHVVMNLVALQNK